MTVTDIYAAGEEYTPEAARDLVGIMRSENNITTLSEKREDVMDQIRIVGGLCNSGEFDASTMHLPVHQRKINGDATDQAVLRLSESLGSVAELRQNWKKHFEIAFNSKNKFMIRLMTPVTQNASNTHTQVSHLIHTSFTDHLSTLMIKGAPDILLPRCSFMLNDRGDTIPMTEPQMWRIEAVKDAWSRQGKRVILLARKNTVVPFSANHEKEVLIAARQGLTFVGIVGIVDPPRDEIPEVVRILRGASIRIFMVTGDFKLTAQAIAEECGIISNVAMLDDASALVREAKLGSTRQALILSGPELITLNEDQWDQLCQYEEIVFARSVLSFLKPLAWVYY
jgi:sodium/potassium-transporting ATPase subunit alpha